MRSPEFESEPKGRDAQEAKRRKIEENESGFSEKQQALDIEMRTGDLAALKKSKTYQSLPTKHKQLVAYKTVSIKLGNVLELYENLVGTDLHRAQKLTGEIAQLKILQTALFNNIIGKTDEELDKNLLAEELQEFL